MKIKMYLLLVMLSTLASAQIKGNAPTISRQNVMSSTYLANPQSYGNAITNFRQQPLVPNANITIDVKALNNVVADAYTAVFNMVQIGETSEQTNNLMTERVNKVKIELMAHGINDNDIVIDVISFVPAYETVVENKLFSKKYNEVPVGFELQQNIHVKFTKVNQFEKILSACANNEIYNLVKVDYFINDIKAVYTTLRMEILKALQEKQQFYKDMGFDLSLYKPMIADTKYCYFPKEFYKNYQAFNCISLEAIKKSKGVLTAKEQTAYYYEPLSFKEYDVVLNPAIVEPVIQVGMEIKLQYIEKQKSEQPKEKEVIKNRFFMVSDEGNINITELKLEQ
ncbi:SIMPL domain-containing protein [Lacinutrix neustonica]|uniref:SIMPL domain-containing protein n=1 Tax=Lacinutrix neustonica TaxID=2980107 RepID=A0A9E8N063_9FLAO|nr:SIMPL domain-containing protein [Lacinutrix neustonica]WAC03687.1 SIMPL domain-containing protein [Lacinutrix neustonica]